MTEPNDSEKRRTQSETDKKDPLKSERKLLLYFTSSAHAYTHIVILAIVPLLPLIQSADGGFNLSWRDTFLFAAVTLFFFGLGAVPMGYVSDRVGPLKVICAGLIVIITSIIVLITAPNIIMFSAGLVLLGLGSSFYHPAGLSLVSQIYTKNRGLPMGIHGSLGNIGELCTPILSGIIGAMFGWRSAYLLWLMVGLVILVINLVLINKGIQDKFISITRTTKNSSDMKTQFIRSFTRIIILALLFALLFELAYRGTNQLIPFTAKAFQGLSAAEAAGIGGIIVTLLMLGGAFAQLIGGRLSDRYGTKLPLFGFTSISIIALILMKSQVFDIPVSVNGTPFAIDSLLVGAVMFGFGLFGTQPIINTILAETTPSEIRGLFYGLTFFIKVGLASIALFALAFISEATINSGFYLMITFALGALIVVMFMDDVGGQKAEY
ncbi:MAG: MFS transporter [Thermoplasmata archaeon]|nr:MAG: MFS transporter [Thermoplasmata archaeon]